MALPAPFIRIIHYDNFAIVSYFAAICDILQLFSYKETSGRPIKSIRLLVKFS